MKLRPSKSLEIIKKLVEEKFETRLDRNTRIPYVVYARYIYYRICKDYILFANTNRRISK